MSKYCPFCGKELSDDAKFCMHCGKSLDLDSNSLNSNNINNNPIKPQNNRNKVIDKIFFKNDKKTGNRRLSKSKIILILVVILFIFMLSMGGSSDTDSGLDYYSLVKASHMPEATYKSQCSNLDYKQLDKNAYNHIDENVTFTGEILQISEGSNITLMRIATSGSYSDVMYVTYFNTTPHVEGDTVTVWGLISGSKTYTSQANYEITIPSMNAVYVE